MANHIQASYVNMIFLDSHVQLYMETIQDLLDPTNDNIAIAEDPKTGDVSLPGATLVEIRDQQSFIELLRLGEAHRFAANTKLNTESSRSHAILMVNELTYIVYGAYILVLLVVIVQCFYF
jgi:kinesin family protein 5